MQDKDNEYERLKPTFDVEDITILLQEYEYRQQENKTLLNKIEANAKRQRQILKATGAAPSEELEKDKMDRWQDAYKKLHDEGNPACEIILFLEHGLGLAESMYYQERRKNKQLKEELDRVRALSN